MTAAIRRNMGFFILGIGLGMGIYLWTHGSRPW